MPLFSKETLKITKLLQKYVIEIHKPPKLLWKHSLFFVTNMSTIGWILLFDGFCPRAVAVRRENSHISVQYIGIATSSVAIMFILTEVAGKFVNMLILLPTHSSAEELAKLTTCSAPRKQMFLKLSKTLFPMLILPYIYFSFPWRGG